MRKTLNLFVMVLFLNMMANVTLGSVYLQNVNKFEIKESILEVSNTAKIVIPKNYEKLADKPILEQFKVGDKVTIKAGYDVSANSEFNTEFTGYITEIDSDLPLTVTCEDESYLLRKTNFTKSYKNVTLKKLLSDIIDRKTGITFECPDVNLGKLNIDNASAFAILQQLMQDYGLYSRMYNGKITVGLAYNYGDNTKTHTYLLNSKPADDIFRGNVKKNDLKYKRKEDAKVRVKATYKTPKGKNVTVEVGRKEKDASEIKVNYSGSGLTESQLKKFAESVLKKIVYDGYTGSIEGFGIPATHAGDSLSIVDSEDNSRNGRYLIEQVEINYDSSDGYSRKNTLSYKV